MESPLNSFIKVLKNKYGKDMKEAEDSAWR